MIKFLANIFRGMSFIVGMSAPPPGEDERRFVLLWLGMIAFLVAFCILLFYAISKIHMS